MRRHLLLSVSFALNLVFAGSLIWLQAPGDNSRIRPPTPTACASLPRVEPEAMPAKIRPLTWKEIASNDEAAYATNLRNLGCPEALIRGILATEISIRVISSDPSSGAVGNLSSANGNKSGSPHQSADASGPDSKADAALETKVVTSKGTTQQPVHEMFEMELEPGQESNAEALVQLITTKTPAMPLAFLADSANLGEAQSNALKSLQDAFVNTMQQTSQNPVDPAYSAQWVVTQSELDEIFHAQFGDEAYNALISSRPWRP